MMFPPDSMQYRKLPMVQRDPWGIWNLRRRLHDEEVFALGFGVVLMIFYSVLFALSGVLLIRRHACPRQSWGFLNVFCHQRIITGAVMIALWDSRSTAKVAMVTILLPTGFLNLVFASIQVLRIAMMHKYPNNPIAPRVRSFVVINWLVYLLGQDLIFITSSFGRPYHIGAFVVVATLLMVLLVGTVQITCAFQNWWKREYDLEPSQIISRRVIIALLPSVVLMVGCMVAMAYTFLSKMAQTTDFNTSFQLMQERGGRIAIGVTLVNEILVAMIFVVLGFSLPRYIDIVQKLESGPGLVQYAVVNCRPMGEARNSSSFFDRNGSEVEIREVEVRSERRSTCEVILEESEPSSRDSSPAEGASIRPKRLEKSDADEAPAEEESVARQDWALEPGDEAPRQHDSHEQQVQETAPREVYGPDDEIEESPVTSSSEGSKNSMPLPPPFVT